jgi:hypothetical protein
MITLREINNILMTKEDIKAALLEKGITVSNNFHSYAEAISGSDLLPPPPEVGLIPADATLLFPNANPVVDFELDPTMHIIAGTGENEGHTVLEPGWCLRNIFCLAPGSPTAGIAAPILHNFPYTGTIKGIPNATVNFIFGDMKAPNSLIPKFYEQVVQRGSSTGEGVIEEKYFVFPNLDYIPVEVGRYSLPGPCCYFVKLVDDPNWYYN